MPIHIKEALSFHCQGQRENNEDYISPREPDQETRLFLLCDGMGGLDKGEKASEITAKAIRRYFDQNRELVVDQEFLTNAVASAHLELSKYMDEHPFLTKMGTTLVLLSINDGDVILAHLGDSRGYHIRAGQILYQTEDHKQVLDMVEQNIITKEQASTHPWRNRLSRSISVRVDDQHKRKYDSCVVNRITDVDQGDHFFICSDGVLEQVTDSILCEIISSKHPNTQKLNEILGKCEGVTKDNYSGYLIEMGR